MCEVFQFWGGTLPSSSLPMPIFCANFFFPIYTPLLMCCSQNLYLILSNWCQGPTAPASLPKCLILLVSSNAIVLSAHFFLMLQFFNPVLSVFNSLDIFCINYPTDFKAKQESWDGLYTNHLKLPMGMSSRDSTIPLKLVQFKWKTRQGRVSYKQIWEIGIRTPIMIMKFSPSTTNNKLSWNTAHQQNSPFWNYYPKRSKITPCTSLE